MMPAFLRLSRPLALVALVLAASALARPALADEGEQTPAAADGAEQTPAGDQSPAGDQAPAAEQAPTAGDASGQKAGQGGKTDPITGVRLGESGSHQEAHILVRRTERAEGKQEISLSAPVQVNGKFTEHAGVGLDWAYHLREQFAFGLGGTWYYRGVESSFTEDELIDKAHQQPFTASAMILQWEGHAGLELQPIYGKMAIGSSHVVQFGYYLGASAGLGQMRVQLRSEKTDANTGKQLSPRTYGDLGLKPVGLFTTGFRLFLGDHVAIKLELRDTIYSDEVTTINGCTFSQLKNSTSGNGCTLPGTDADKSIAADLLKDVSSDVLNNIAFAAAVSVLF